MISLRLQEYFRRLESGEFVFKTEAVFGIIPWPIPKYQQRKGYELNKAPHLHIGKKKKVGQAIWFQFSWFMKKKHKVGRYKHFTYIWTPALKCCRYKRTLPYGWKFQLALPEKFTRYKWLFPVFSLFPSVSLFSKSRDK